MLVHVFIRIRFFTTFLGNLDITINAPKIEPLNYNQSIVEYLYPTPSLASGTAFIRPFFSNIETEKIRKL